MQRTSRGIRVRALGATLLLGLLFGGALAPAGRADEPAPSRRDRLVGLLKPDVAADFFFCEHLGWRFVDEPRVTEITVHTGRPCTRENLRDAMLKGDLIVRIPSTASDALLLEFAEKIPFLADSIGSRCAYLLKLADAQERAMEKLVARQEAELWTFPQLWVIESPFWVLKPPCPEWMPVEKAWRPTNSARAAMESFYTKEAVTECYVGQLLGLFAAQYELYGPERFDKAFAPTDIWLGRPPQVENVPFGWNTWTPGYHNRRALFIEGDAQNKDPALTLAALGPKAFTSMAGIIRDPLDRIRCNENFVIVRVSDRAMRELVADGGFVAIKKATAQAREITRRSDNLFTMADQLVENRRQIEEIFARPIFTEIEVFIHPYGVVTVGWVAKEKLKFKRAGITMDLYCSGRENAFFHRYRQTFAMLYFAQHHPDQRPGPRRMIPSPKPPDNPIVTEHVDKLPPTEEPERPSPVRLVGG